MTDSSEAGSRRFDLPERREQLELLSRTLDREAHVLAAQPDLLWQQLYNRLQWENHPVRDALAPELARRAVPGTTPWLRLRAPFRESEALLRTLAGHAGDVVCACAISPDGSFVVSTSAPASDASPTTARRAARLAALPAPGSGRAAGSAGLSEIFQCPRSWRVTSRRRHKRV